ncbi:MAG TPA: hypothetical protein V6D17_20155 [Candidatus Obscuribacterales bacterium]
MSRERAMVSYMVSQRAKEISFISRLGDAEGEGDGENRHLL